MENQPTALDKAVKISIIAGALIIALSVAYYLVIFLPKKEATRLEVQRQEKQEVAEEKEEASEEPTITPPFLEKAPVLQNAPAIIEQQQSIELTAAQQASDACHRRFSGRRQSLRNSCLLYYDGLFYAHQKNISRQI